MEESRNDGNSSGAPVDEGGDVVYFAVNIQDGGGEQRKSNKKLFWVLIVLVIAIVGLSVGIVIITMNNRDLAESEQGNIEEVSVVEPIELSYEEQINNVAVEILQSGSDDAMDRAMVYFDELKEAADNKDDVFDIESVRVNFLLRRGYYDRVLYYLEKIDVEDLNEEQSWTVYNYFDNVYDALGDNEKSIEYRDKAQMILDKIQENY